ncbi:internal virion protein with endolysin domain [Caulobacter phage Lullwater]|uniref:Internal virion protein n=1 Tax=Caulobacter phage Lullwater TaxID=2024607 RepID=A0A291LBA4_9CAUD|nr:internal virion protein with endolysin domain [Caulobacter phage Lullwater]ATI16346.1 internal virion protein [Caulobacter phage Lullwater]
MDINDLRGKSRADQFAAAAEFAGVSPAVFDGMWKTESSRGVNMRSPAGAKGHFGIMDATRSTWEKRVGTKLNPDDFTDGLYLAALTLKENMKSSGGNIVDALRMYNGGTDRRRWNNPETQAYAKKVMGDAKANVAQEPDGLTVADLSKLDSKDILNMRPGEPLRREPRGPQEKKPTHEQLTAGMLGISAFDAKPNDTSSADNIQTINKGQVDEQAKKDSYTADDKMRAAFNDVSLTAAAYRAISRSHTEEEPGFSSWYLQNMGEIEKFAQNSDEAKWLRRAGSQAELKQIQQEITDQRQRRSAYMSGGSGETMMWSLAGGVLDPLGWAAGFGVGKVAQVAGVGSRALMTAGKTGSALASMTAENVVGNLLTTSTLDALGQYQSTTDYQMAIGSGLAISGITTPFMLLGKADHAVVAAGEAMRERGARDTADLAMQAQANHPNGTPEQIAAEMARLDGAARMNDLNSSLAPVPDSRRLLPRDTSSLLTMEKGPDGVEKQVMTPAMIEVAKTHDLRAVSDPVMRTQVAEVIAKSDAIMAETPVNQKAVNTLMSKATFGGDRGLESTNTTLLGSKSKVLQAFGVLSTESPTGATARGRNAAIQKFTRERLYMGHMQGYEDMYHLFRKDKGVSVVDDFHNGTARREFNKRVFLEISARKLGRASTENNPAVLRVVDDFNRGMVMMRDDQQAADVIGSSRLHGEWYVPHRMDGAKVRSLTSEQTAAVRNALKEQFMDIDLNGIKDKDGKVRQWDEKFAEETASRYLETALGKTYKTVPVPMNIYDVQAAGIFKDVMHSLGIQGMELQELMGRYSRGGKAHTKSRLGLDMFTPIPDADGVQRGGTLADLFITDIPSLYRQYAAGVSGEVALAAHGVPGKQGLEVIRRAAVLQGATTGEIQAFDQVASEFLNTDFGTNNHRILDNARTLNSLVNLGGAGFNQMGEYANAINMLGVQRTFSAIGALPRMLKEVGQIRSTGHAKNEIIGSLEKHVGHFGLDDYHFSRLFDVPDQDIKLYGEENVGAVTKAIRAGAYAQNILSFNRALSAAQTRGMAEQITLKAAVFIREGKDDVALRDMGISKKLQAKIKADLGNIAEFDGKGNLTKFNFDNTKLAYEDQAEFAEAVLRGSHQIIQHTFIGETGKWAHDGLLKLLFQFRTYSLTAVEKQYKRNVVAYGNLRAFAAMMGSLSFALPIHMTRVHVKTLGMSRSDREEYIKRNLSLPAMAQALPKYASNMGLAPDLYDVGVGFAGGYLGDGSGSFSDVMGVRKQGQDKLFGSNIAPSISTLDNAWSAAHGNAHAAAQVAPGSRLPFVLPLINALKGDDE